MVPRVIKGGCNRKLILIRIKLEEFEMRAHIFRRMLVRLIIKVSFGYIANQRALYFENSILCYMQIIPSNLPPL